MSKVLVVLGSARKGRVADKISDYVTVEIKKHAELEVTVADLKELDLPFFNHHLSPKNPDYVITHEHVLEWQKLVKESDVVVFLTPEYNHGVSSLQKNAIDSLAAEWKDKKVAIVGYNWGTSFAIDQIKQTLEFLETKLIEPVAHLAFTKDIALNGEVIDGGTANAQIAATIDAIAV